MLKNYLKISLIVFVMLFMNMNNIQAQAQLDIPITISNDLGTSTSMAVGLDQSATSGIDFTLGEANLPPLPPSGAWDVRFDLGGGFSSFKDYRNAAAFPYTGTYTHVLKWQQQTGASTITIGYDLPANSTLSIQDQFGGVLISAGPFTGSGSYTVTNAAITAVNLIMDYNGVTLPVSGPMFSVSPSSPLTIPPTAVSGSNSSNITVSNTGTGTLNITGITSSDPQFVIAPATASIAAGSEQVFVVTFTPTSLGGKTTTLEFTHDGTNGPATSYVVNGTGADAGPTFSANPNSLTFHTNQNVPVSQNITVTNNGLTNTLNISSVVTSAPFSVNPVSATIAPGSSQIFSVTFNPTSGGTFNANLTFNHDGTTSPDVISLSGDAVSVFGLVFKEEQRFVREDSSYTDTLQLKSLNATAQAIQFRLLVNKATDDNSILTFQSIEKGSDVSSANWSLQYQIFRGPLSSNGSSIDSIYVLLYNLQQNSGLLAGDYEDLLRVKYRVADLSALTDTSKSSFKVALAEASTYQGYPIDINPSRDEFKVFALNRASSQGDVNGDGSIDILDLIKVVDHIIGRDSLNASEFARADIAPWPNGAQFPNPDGFVNVQDLSVIQNIILTREYPSGVVLNKSSLFANNGTSLHKDEAAKTKVMVYMTKEGISVKLNSDEAIRGAQLEFGNISGNTGNMVIDSRLGGGFYNQSNDKLRVLLYDQSGKAVLDAGENFMANIPFTLGNPNDISVDKVILVNANNQKIGEISVEIIYSNAPEVPVEYSLSQNYPNPFNPNTTVQFSVPKEGLVTVKVFDMLGQEVVTLFSGNAQRGMYTLNWNGRDRSGKNVSSGSYIYRMSANNGEFTQSKKMLLLK